MRKPTSTTRSDNALRRLVPTGLIVAAAVVVSAPSAPASAGEASHAHDPAARIWWSGPDRDGGYGCLSHNADPSQCDAAMGLGPWHIPATDGGYLCLRETGGASGQCDEAMGLGRPAQRR